MRSNQIHIKAAFAVLISATLLSINACQTREEVLEKIMVVDFSFSLPVIDLQGKVNDVADTVRIFQIGDDLIYRLSTIALRYKNNQLTSQSKNYEYFLYRVGDSIGTYYDTTLSPFVKPISVDSALRQRVFYGQKIGDRDEDTLIRQTTDDSAYDLVEQYRPKNFGPDESADSIYVYYNKSLTAFHHSLSKLQDSTRKMKAVRMRVIYLPRKYTDVPGIVKRREFLFDMEQKFDYDRRVVKELLAKIRQKRLL